MKKLSSFIILVFSVVNLFGQNNLKTTKATEKSLPTNLNQENFKAIRQFDGKIVAFDGTIEKV